MSEQINALARSVATSLGVDPDAVSAAIREHIRERSVGTPNTEVHSIDSLLTEEPLNVIQLNPVTTLSGGLGEFKGWNLYIPPTTLEAFDHPENGEDYLPREMDLREPYGSQQWPTLSGAVASLSLAVKSGSIKFNDGRIAR